MTDQFDSNQSPTTPDGQSLASAACALLEAQGWREYPDASRQYARCFFRQFQTATPCRCNGEKPGIQVSVAVAHHGQWCNYEIELHGELPDGTWIQLLKYGMPPDINAGLATIPRLLATWEFMATHT